MAGRSLFGRKRDGDKDDDEQEATPKRQPEGVRVLQPDQAAEAEKKDTTVKRRTGATPKYGDRPAAPETENKPAIRLPLARTTSLDDVERPKAAPRPVATGQQRL